MKKFEGKWLPDSNTYKDACINISINLNNFKRNPIYAGYIGNDLRNEQTAIAFYNYIKNNYFFLLNKDYLNSFITNDKIGNPMIYNIDGINISSGTLRFMKVLGDILSIDKDIKKI